jgi:mono/diheme cytochrome c family protein
MRLSLVSLGLMLVTPSLCAAWPQGSSQNRPSEKGADSAPLAKVDREAKNPVKPTPDNLAQAKKVFGYDCAMCHGADGDGKGDLAASMGLKVNDWRDSSRLLSVSDGEIFEVIEKGKGRMVGEGDRYSPQEVWALVNYVRTFEKSQTAATQKPAPSH